jgi:hypothetical protein
MSALGAKLKGIRMRAIENAITTLEANGYTVIPPIVGKCALAECGVTFFVKRGANGAPRRKFCCREHMLKNHDLGASQRVRDARLYKKIEAARMRVLGTSP